MRSRPPTMAVPPPNASPRTFVPVKAREPEAALTAPLADAVGTVGELASPLDTEPDDPAEDSLADVVDPVVPVVVVVVHGLVAVGVQPLLLLLHVLVAVGTHPLPPPLPQLLVAVTTQPPPPLPQLLVAVTTQPPPPLPQSLVAVTTHPPPEVVVHPVWAGLVLPIPLLWSHSYPALLSLPLGY